jgi:hypothetical protein
MSIKITLQDFGKLVKPKILVEAYLLCNKDVDAGDWWKKVVTLDANSKSYRCDTIQSIYGTSLNHLFESIDIETYVGVVSSFIVFHQGAYKFVNNREEAEKILSSNKRYVVRGVGLKLYYTKDLTAGWEPTEVSTIQWFYRPMHLIDLETIESYESICVGDMLVFKKTQALVTGIKTLKRKKFWATCSWTRKKITILNGSTGHQMRLNTNRPFTILKSK